MYFFEGRGGELPLLLPSAQTTNNATIIINSIFKRTWKDYNSSCWVSERKRERKNELLTHILPPFTAQVSAYNSRTANNALLFKKHLQNWNISLWNNILGFLIEGWHLFGLKKFETKAVLMIFRRNNAFKENLKIILIVFDRILEILNKSLREF